jgi:ADP-heptose:LPS heptosyltransferase
MGFGDELMAAGQARKMNETDPRRVQIIDRYGNPRWHPVFENNSRLARPGEEGDFQKLHNGPGNRPYILGKAHDRWTWRNFQCTPGEIFFTQAEKQFASAYRPQIIIEPTLKSRASPNKQWGLDRWQHFAKIAKKAGYGLTQLGAPGTRPLQHATMIATPDFRHACAVLANAKAYVGHEGGLHHAAAALGIPAVVIFGGFISPAQTGYATHRNLFTGAQACGMRTPCRHCETAMEKITPEMVLKELMEIYG